MNVLDGVDRPVCELEDDCDDEDLRPVRESQIDILRILSHRYSNKECSCGSKLTGDDATDLKNLSGSNFGWPVHAAQMLRSREICVNFKSVTLPSYQGWNPSLCFAWAPEQKC
jgi:hypothetical protein